MAGLSESIKRCDVFQGDTRNGHVCRGELFLVFRGGNTYELDAIFESEWINSLVHHAESSIAKIPDRSPIPGDDPIHFQMCSSTILARSD